MAPKTENPAHKGRVSCDNFSRAPQEDLSRIARQAQFPIAARNVRPQLAGTLKAQRTTQLREEMFAAVGAIRQRHLDRLVQLGVPLPAIMELGSVQPAIGACKVKRLPGRRFQPDRDGVPCLIIPVTQTVRFELWEMECETVEFVDLIAFPTSAPATWLWRDGNGWALSGHHLMGEYSGPVRLVATPLEWLAQAGKAVCILDWSDTSPVWPLLHREADLIVDDDLLRAKLGAALRRTAPTPRFWRSSDAA